MEKPGLLKDTITTAQADYKHTQFASQVHNYMQTVQPQPTSNTSAHSSANASHQIATELEKLFELKQKGVLSEEEYQKAKAKLLG